MTNSTDNTQVDETEAINAAYERYESLVGAGTRVRVTFEDRKMSVPGRICLTNDRRPTLHTNWGLEIDLTHENVVSVETKDLSSGRFVQVA